MHCLQNATYFCWMTLSVGWMVTRSKQFLITYLEPLVWSGGCRLPWFSFRTPVSYPCSFFSSLTYSAIAQFFQAADQIVVLGDHKVVEQGTWENFKFKAASIAKFSSSHQSKDNAILSANFDKLSAQFRTKDEAEIDLTRQSGDSALYGNFPSQFH